MHAAGRRSKGDDRRRARNKARDSYDVRRPSPANNRMDRSGCGAKLAGIAFAYVRHLHGPTPRATRARGTCDPRLLCRWGAGPAAHARGCSGSQPSGVTAQTASLVGVGAPPGGPQWRGQTPFGRSRSYLDSILPGARCAVQWPLPAHIDNNRFTVFTCLLPVVLTFIFLFS